MRVPAFSAVVAGQPAAVSASLAEMDKSPEAEVLRKHKDEMMQAGLGLYRSLSGDIGVIFNNFYISPEELKAADKAGALQQVAPPLQQVNQSVATSGDQHPVLTHSGQVPASFATPPPPVMPTSSAAPKPAAAAQAKLSNQRAKNVQVGSPTSGPRPGAGRILNSIMKRAV